MSNPGYMIENRGCFQYRCRARGYSIKKLGENLREMCVGSDWLNDLARYEEKPCPVPFTATGGLSPAPTPAGRAPTSPFAAATT